MPEEPSTGPAGPTPPAGSPGLGRREAALLVVLGSIWGSAFAVIQYGIFAGAPPLLFAAVRCAIGAGGVGLMALASREALPSRRSIALSWGLGGPLIMGGYFAFLYVGEEVVPGGLSSILVATNSLWSALFATALLPKERLGRFGGAGLAVGFVGVLTIFLPSLPGGPTPLVAGLLEVMAAPLLFALGTVLLRRSAQGPQGFWGISSQLAAGAVFLFATAAVLEPGRGLPLNRGVELSLLFLVLAPTCVGYAVYFHLHHRVGPTHANLVSFISPISGVLVGVALLGQVPTLFDVAGFALVAFGLYLVGRDRRPPPAGGPPVRGELPSRSSLPSAGREAREETEDEGERGRPSRAR